MSAIPSDGAEGAIRVGIIGCGAAARRIHLPGLRAAGFEVTAFSSRTPASAQAACADWGSGIVIDDWRAAIVRDDVDAVVLATPNSLHAEGAIAAAAAGKHVLVEKPMATTVAEADAMVGAAHTAGTVLMPAHNLRFASPFVAMAQAVARGDVGEVVAVRAAFGHGGPQGWAPESTWFREPAMSGGGALIDLGIHMIDVLHAVLGEHVAEVGATLWGHGPVEDAAQLVLRFAHGASGSLHASWVTVPGPDHQLTIFGREGTLHLDGATPPMLRRPGAEPERVRASGERADLYRGFATAIASGGPPPVTAAEGRAALAVVTAAYEAAATRSFVRLSATA